MKYKIIYQLFFKNIILTNSSFQNIGKSNEIKILLNNNFQQKLKIFIDN
jgi:hypothetical protein